MGVITRFSLIELLYLYLAEAEVGFVPAVYTVMEGDGEIVLSLEILNLSGSLECNLMATIILSNGTNASMRCWVFSIL